MELKDALTVTVLGITVVFMGLILTSLMIYSFSLVPGIKRLFGRKEVNAAVSAAPANVTADVEPEVIAVITAVLEVEFRKLSLLEGKFTFR